MEDCRLVSNSYVGKMKFGILLFLNLLILIIGLTLFVMDCILWEKIKNFNTFVLSLILISLYIISVTVFGFVKLKSSEDALLVYFVLISVMWLGFLILTIYIYNNKLNLITFLVKNMDDSYEAIFRASIFAAKNLDTIKCLLIISLVILGLVLVMTIIYRYDLKNQNKMKYVNLLHSQSINDI